MHSRVAYGSILVLSLFAFAGVWFTSIARAADDAAPAAKPRQVQRIDVNEFDQKRKEPYAVVLDVRTRHEFEAGHVPGAVNLDIHDPKFTEKLQQLDKSKTYLVHCAKGVRSEAATKKMAAAGFSNLYDFHGGFSAWENAHKPIEKGPGDADAKK